LNKVSKGFKIKKTWLKLKYYLLKILLKVFFFYFKKVETNYYKAIYNKAYIICLDLFPHHDLRINQELSLDFTGKIIYDVELKENIVDLNREDIDLVQEKSLENEWIKNNAINYYRFKSYSIIFNKDIKQKYLDKARKLNSNCNPIDKFKEVIELSSQVKKDYKLFLKKARKLNNEKYEDEIKKRINPINISSKMISFLLTLFSTFFLISGIIYSKIYFYLLGINISDFFSLGDYLASSIDTLIITFFSIAMGMFFYFKGAKDRLKTSIHEEQFQIKSNNKFEKFNLLFINLNLIGLFLYFYFSLDRLYYSFLYPPILFVFFRYFWSLPIWDYFKNPEKVGFVLMSFSTFIISLILTALTYHDDIIHKEVKDDKYIVTLKNKTKDINNSIFITSNSSNVFMLNVETKKIKIIPLYNIESIETKEKE